MLDVDFEKEFTKFLESNKDNDVVIGLVWSMLILKRATVSVATMLLIENLYKANVELRRELIDTTSKKGK